MAALTFSFDTLKTGGHFLCKFYQGSEEKAFETKLKRLFAKVSREKPDSSRSVGESILLFDHPLILLGIKGGILCRLAAQGGSNERRGLPGVRTFWWQHYSKIVYSVTDAWHSRALNNMIPQP